MTPPSTHAGDTAPVHLLAALALELTPGTGASREALDQDGAAALAARIAQDLAAFVPDATARELMERGMAGAATALLAQEAFGLQVEHARYLTVHDLLAMTALQYEHGGLAPLWPLLETALLSPGGACVLDAPPEPLVSYAGGQARIALLDPQAWCRRNAPGVDCDDPGERERLARQYRHFEARQRQFAEVLMAHAIPVTLEHQPQTH